MLCFGKSFENLQVTSSSSHTSSDTPSQRVQFILGNEEDAEHVSHELFTELDEICVKDGKDAEWKETARSGYLLRELLVTVLSNKVSDSLAALQRHYYEEGSLQEVVTLKAHWRLAQGEKIKSRESNKYGLFVLFKCQI